MQCSTRRGVGGRFARMDLRCSGNDGAVRLPLSYGLLPASTSLSCHGGVPGYGAGWYGIESAEVRGGGILQLHGRRGGLFRFRGGCGNGIGEVLESEGKTRTFGTKGDANDGTMEKKARCKVDTETKG